MKRRNWIVSPCLWYTCAVHVGKLNFINDYKDEEEKLNSEPVSDNIHVHVVQRNFVSDYKDGDEEEKVSSAHCATLLYQWLINDLIMIKNKSKILRTKRIKVIDASKRTTPHSVNSGWQANLQSNPARTRSFKVTKHLFAILQIISAFCNPTKLETNLQFSQNQIF